MDKDTALRKIQKCLALSKSSEPHEAARAMRQAQALMERFNVEHPELLAIGVEQEWTKSRASKTPPRYEAALAATVARNFGCELIFSRRWAQAKMAGGYVFVGARSTAQVAAYTFAVLSRKLTAARTEYAKLHLARYSKNKVAAADLFCDGWVLAIARDVATAALSDGDRAALEAYMGIHFGNTGTLRTTSRELADSGRADRHHGNGWIEGKKAGVNPGIAAKSAAPAQLALC